MRACCCEGITCFFPDGSGNESGVTGTCCYMEPLGNCCVQSYVYPNDPSSSSVEYLEKVDCIKELTKSECDSYNILGQQKGTWTLYGAPTTCEDPDKAECSETMCGSNYPGEDDPGDDVPPGFCKLYRTDLFFYEKTEDLCGAPGCQRKSEYTNTIIDYYFGQGGNDILNRYIDPSITDRDIDFSRECDPQFPAESKYRLIYKVKTSYLGLKRNGTKHASWRDTKKLSENNPNFYCDLREVFSTDESGPETGCSSDGSTESLVPPSSNTSLAPLSSTGNFTRSKRHVCDCISNITECDCANKNAKSWDATRDPITGYSGKTGGDWIWTESGDCNLTTAGATGIIGCRGACCVSIAGTPTEEDPCPGWVGIECIDNTTQCECDNFTEYGSDGQATKLGDFKGLGTTCDSNICLPPCAERSCIIYELYELTTEESDLPDCSCSKFNPNCSSTTCGQLISGASGTPNCADRIECTDCPTRNPFNCRTVSGFVGGNSWSRVTESYGYYLTCGPGEQPVSITETRVDDTLGPTCTSTYTKTYTRISTPIQRVPPGPVITSLVPNFNVVSKRNVYGCLDNFTDSGCGTCVPFISFCGCC